MKYTLNQKDVIKFIRKTANLNRRVDIRGTNQIQLFSTGMKGWTFRSGSEIRQYLFGAFDSLYFGPLTFQDIFPQISGAGMVNFSKKVFIISTSDRSTYTIELAK